MQHFDFIIAGGGCAGLSLAHRLLDSPLRERSILVIDRDDKDQNDRTWAFWTDRPDRFETIVHRKWDRLRFVGMDRECTVPLGDWQYVMIRGDDFYRHLRASLAAHPNVTWLKAPIRRIVDGEDGAIVHTGDPDEPGAYLGGFVFDSIFSILDFKPDSRCRYLQQHFKGWFIETPSDCLDPDRATLFDFRTPQQQEMRFFYCLPTTPRTALVEYVGLSHADFDELLAGYVQRALGVSEHRVVSDEIGITPLTDHPFPRRAGRRIMAVGIPGGLVKPTTGYAYTRIQQDSAAIVRSLVAHGHPFDVPDSPLLYRWLDSVMLEVMRAEPEQLAPAFEAMFVRNPGPRVCRFLDERATPADIVRLVAALPFGPFLRAVGRLALPGRAPGRMQTARRAAVHRRR